MVWKVWYQPNAKFGKKYTRGTLRVEPGNVSFEGTKDSFTIQRARSIERKSVGMTTWNVVEFEENGETRQVCFVDRRMLGWSGILGANDRMIEDLRAALLPS
jgi:hypothetical protein